MRLPVVGLAAVILLAGCSYEPETRFTVPDDAASTADTFVGNGYTLRVQVVDLNGTPLSRVAVVLFHAGAPVFSFDGSAGSEGATGSSEWRLGGDEVVAGLRTNTDGWISAEIEPGRSIDVAAGGVGGFTTELRPGVAVGGAGQSGTLTIPLYPAQLTVSFDAVAQNMVGTAGIGSPAYETFPIVFDADHDDGFHARLDAARITMDWTNLPMQAGDLYVGLSAGDARPFVAGQDSRQIDIGPQSEVVDADPGDVRPERSALAQRGAHATALTDRAGLGIDGIPLSFTVDAQFRGSNVVIH